MRENNRYRIETMSLTDAMKKQKVLSKWAIPCEIVKIEQSGGKKGCTYAIEFAAAHKDNVMTALAEGGEKVRKWKKD